MGIEPTIFEQRLPFVYYTAMTLYRNNYIVGSLLASRPTQWGNKSRYSDSLLGPFHTCEDIERAQRTVPELYHTYLQAMFLVFITLRRRDVGTSVGSSNCLDHKHVQQTHSSRGQREESCDDGETEGEAKSVRVISRRVQRRPHRPVDDNCGKMAGD